MSFEVEEDLPSLGLEIFDVLGLIQDHVIPFLPSKNRVISNSYLIASDTNMKRIQL